MTFAKIGRSIKNREIIAAKNPPPFLGGARGGFGSTFYFAGIFFSGGDPALSFTSPFVFAGAALVLTAGSALAGFPAGGDGFFALSGAPDLVSDFGSGP